MYRSNYMCNFITIDQRVLSLWLIEHRVPPENMLVLSHCSQHTLRMLIETICVAGCEPETYPKTRDQHPAPHPSHRRRRGRINQILVTFVIVLLMCYLKFVTILQ